MTIYDGMVLGGCLTLIIIILWKMKKADDILAKEIAHIIIQARKEEDEGDIKG